MLWCRKAPAMIQDLRLQKFPQGSAPGPQQEGKGPPFLPAASSQIKLFASAARDSDLNDLRVWRTWTSNSRLKGNFKPSIQ